MTELLRHYRNAFIAATLLALYLRFGLPATAMLCYELHHLTGIDFIYWGYSIFKVAGYYFGVWAYQTASCVLAGLALFLVLAWRGARRRRRQASAAGTAA